MKYKLNLLVIVILTLVGCDDYVYRGYSSKCASNVLVDYDPYYRISYDSIQFCRLVVDCDSMLKSDYGQLNYRLRLWYENCRSDPYYTLDFLKYDKRVKLVTWNVFSPMKSDGNTYNYGTMIETNKGTVNIKSNK